MESSFSQNLRRFVWGAFHLGSTILGLFGWYLLGIASLVVGFTTLGLLSSALVGSWWPMLISTPLTFICWAFLDRNLSPHIITRNFPVVGWARFACELIGPEMRQYFVAQNNEERPFSRDDRTYIVASAKGQNNLSGFGTDNDPEETPNHLTLLPAGEPHPSVPSGKVGGAPDYKIPCAKVWGEARNRRRKFRPNSVIMISAMSYGSLGKAAIRALSRGGELSDSLLNTGEGGLSPYHVESGADLVFQIGTAYFGCRDENGNFDLSKLKALVEKYPQIRAIEVKLSQGAKPNKGGMLPAEKVTPEIAEIRGIPVGQDCLSPSKHSAFDGVDGLIDFVEMIAEETGLPVGIKSAVGKVDFWDELAQKMRETSRGPDFIAIDGGEGGTGAAPFVFADNVGVPFRRAFARVYNAFYRIGMHNQVVWIGSGRLGLPRRAATAFALGVDMIAVAREAMLSIGCIQAQKCHLGHCPAGVATHHPWLMGGLDPTEKGARCANYLTTFRHDMLVLTHALGHGHPAQITLDDLEFEQEGFETKGGSEVFGYEGSMGVPDGGQTAAVLTIMGSEPQASAASSLPA